jgi:hypothetical protein
VFRRPAGPARSDYSHHPRGEPRANLAGNPPCGGGSNPRGRDDPAGPVTDTEDMEFLATEIISPLLSAPVILTTVAVALVLLSGIAADVLSCVENLGSRWEARSLVRHPAGARYGTDVRAELENI